MSLSEEKKLVKEIEQLKQSKKTAAQFATQEEVRLSPLHSTPPPLPAPYTAVVVTEKGPGSLAATVGAYVLMVQYTPRTGHVDK